MANRTMRLMSADPNPDPGSTRASSLFVWVVRAISLLLILGSLLVVVGWALDVEVLMRVTPTLRPMMPLTAAGFLLAGVSLALLCDPEGAPWHRRLGRVLAAALLLLGAGVLLQYLLNTDFGIDRLLFPDAVARADVELPGRPAQSAALGMILSGAALLVLIGEGRRSVRASQMLALLVVLLSLSMVVGYLYDVEDVYGFAGNVPMAFHSALGFLALGLGILLVRPNQGPMSVLMGRDSGGHMCRRLLLAAIALPVVLGWLRIRGEEAGFFGTEFGVTLLVILMMSVFSALVWWNARTVHNVESERERLIERERRAAEAEKAARRESVALLESTAEGIYGLDVEGRCTFINGAGADMLGYRREEVIGRKLHGRIHGQGPDGMPRPVEECPTCQVIRTGETARVEGERLRRKDGTDFPAHYTSSPIRDEGQVTGAVVAFIDITERMQSEEALREAKEVAERQWRRFEAMLSSTADFIYLLDPSGRFQYANRALLRLWGRDLPDIVGKNFEKLGYPSELAELHRSQLDRVVSTRSPVRGENPYTSPTGETGYYEYIFVPVFGEDGEIEAIAGVTRDMTEWKRVEEERQGLLEAESEARSAAERLAREEQALRRAIEALAGTFSVAEAIRIIAESALWAMDAVGAFVERLDSVQGEVEVIATTGEGVPPEGTRLRASASFAERVLRRGEPMIAGEQAELPHPVPHLIERWPDCSALALPLTDGNPVGVLVLVRDPATPPFSEGDIDYATTFARLAVLAFRKVHLLEESERARDRIQHLMESRTRLMRGFSHDVKNPLGAADGTLTLLETGVLGEVTAEQRRYLARARRSIRNAVELIDDLLAFAHAEAERIEIDRRLTDVREVASEAVDEYRAKAKTKGLDLVAELPEQASLVRSDASRIHQILRNLLSNAVAYTAEGGVTVRVEEREGGGAPGPGRWIAVAVSDTGSGVRAEDRQRLFQEFTRLTPEVGRGAGVGLAISQKIAHALGGEITLESEPGLGSTFTLWIPVDDGSEE